MTTKKCDCSGRPLGTDKCPTCQAADAATEELIARRSAAACSAWVDIPDRPGIWWKCFEGHAPHVVEIIKHDVALFKTYGHDFRGPETRIKYKWLPKIDPPESFEPNVKAMATPLAGCSVERGVDVGITWRH